MILRYTPRARTDLREVQEYISTTLKNPAAADRIVAKILESCSLLKGQPYMGAALAEKVGRETDLRYLISGKYIVFYRVGQELSLIHIWQLCGAAAQHVGEFPTHR